MKNLNKILSLFMISFFLLSGINDAFSTVVTVTLQDENGAALANYPPSATEMSYQYRCGGSWHYGGYVHTDGSGQFLTEDITCSNWDGKITLNLHQTSKELVVSGGAVTFMTAKVNVNLKNPCSGLITESPGGTVRQGGGHWYIHGTTSGTGVVTFYAFPGNVKLEMNYHYKTITQNPVAIATGVNEVDFLTTTVNIVYGGTVKYSTGGWPTITFPFEMLQADHTLKFGNIEKTINVSGCTLDGSVIIANLLNSDGDPVENGTVQLGVGGWPVIGNTDKDGQLFYFYNNALGNMRLKMTAPNYGGTETSAVQYIPSNSVFNFQTQQVVIKLFNHAGVLTTGGTVAIGYGGWPVIGQTGDNGQGILYHEHFLGFKDFRMYYNGTMHQENFDLSDAVVFQTMQAEIHLLDHDGNFMDGGKVSFGISGWPVIGTTGQGGNPNGKVYHEIFPGTYTYRMSLNYATDEKSQDVGTVATPIPVVFQTGEVILHFTGSIDVQVSGWPVFSSPLEMLPVPINFRFSGVSQPSILHQITPVAGDTYEKSAAYMRILNSSGAGIPGCEGFYNEGGYQSAGTTNSDGVVLALLDGHVTYPWPSFQMEYNGFVKGTSWNISSNSFVMFQTKAIVAKLEDSYGGPLYAEVFQFIDGYGNKIPLSFGADNSCTAPIELLPLWYTFYVKYQGHEKSAGYNASKPGNEVIFTTNEITVELEDAGGNPLIADEFFYQDGDGNYQSIATNTSSATIEMLPLWHRYKCVYNGSALPTKQVNTGSVQLVTFIGVPPPPAVKGFYKDAITRITDQGIYRICPNPVSSTATIEFGVSTDSQVSITVYDQSGNMVKELENSMMTAGNHKVTLNKDNLKPGVYYCRMITADKVSVKSFVIK